MSDFKFGQDHVQQYRESDGEEGYIWRKGSEILLLVTRGRKSGEERWMPLIFREVDGEYVIVASKGGHPEHPAWFVNMRANPGEVRIQVKADVFDVDYRVAEGAERERLWELMTEVWPDYEDYQAKTDRQIPIVVLTRRPGSSAA
jgi:deazaflavin-dependent oxidoreductase (nitroreductase family)